jgi:hypothetical protein
MEDAAREPVAEFLRYFRVRGPARIYEGLQAAGMLPSNALLQDTTSRVLEEAVGQLLTEYTAARSQASVSRSIAVAGRIQQYGDGAAFLADNSSSHVGLQRQRTSSAHSPCLTAMDLPQQSQMQSHTAMPQIQVEPSTNPDSNLDNALSTATNIAPATFSGSAHILDFHSFNPYSSHNVSACSVASSPVGGSYHQLPVNWQAWNFDSMLTPAS